MEGELLKAESNARSGQTFARFSSAVLVLKNVCCDIDLLSSHKYYDTFVAKSQEICEVQVGWFFVA